MNTPNTENIIMNQLFSLAQASEQYKKVEYLSYAGTKFFSDGTDIYATIDKPQQASEYNLSIISGEDGNPSAKLNPVRRAVKVCIAGLGDTSTGDITDKVISTMAGEAADSVVDSLADIYGYVKDSEEPEHVFNDIFDSIRERDTTMPGKKINPAGLPPRARSLYEGIMALRQCPNHIDNTLNTMHARYNETHAPKGSIFQIVEERYKITHPVPEHPDTQPPDTQARKTIYQKIRDLPQTIRNMPGIIKENYQQIVTGGVVCLAVGSVALMAGCVDKPEELQDKVNIYVYEEAGGEGNPEEQIHEFYDMVSSQTGGEQSGPPEIVPVAQYAVELDPDTGDVITIYDPDGNPVDRETALSMQDDIVRDNAGNIITDAALLDLHIDPIGKNKYQILNLKQELEDPDGGIWRIKGFPEHDSFDKKLVDNIMEVGDHKDEITGGFVLGSDGNIYGVIIADEDVFDMYGGDFRTKARDLSDTISKEECIDLGGGLYAYLYNLSETPKGGASVHSPQPYCEEIAAVADRENNGKFAQFMFVKESS